ncbi:MAG: AI-2E family transporter [Candidatus Eremiobacteraeota bacterium]|nr:AI-2E family transporter [Candidatus Eremiobacteraeota bacterium]
MTDDARGGRSADAPWSAERTWTMVLKVFGSIVLGGIIVVFAVRFFSHINYTAYVFIGALLVSYFVFPAVRWLNAQLPLWAAIAIVYVGVLVLIALAVWYIAPAVSNDLHSLVGALPALQKTAQHDLTDPSNPLLSRLPPSMRTYASNLPGEVGNFVRQNASNLAKSGLAIGFSVLSVAALFIVIPVVSMYMLGEAERLKRFFIGMLPPARRAHAVDMIAELDNTVGGWIRGQIIVAIVVGVLVTVMLVILHVPYAGLIGTFAGVIDIIPYLGAFAGAIPGVVLAVISNGIFSAIEVTIGFVIINQLEGHLLSPRIISRTVGVTPLTVIFALIIGGELFGLPGLIVAVPVAGILRVMIRNIRPSHPVTNAEIRPGLSQGPRSRLERSATST